MHTPGQNQGSAHVTESHTESEQSLVKFMSVAAEKKRSLYQSSVKAVAVVGLCRIIGLNLHSLQPTHVELPAVQQCGPLFYQVFYDVKALCCWACPLQLFPL